MRPRKYDREKFIQWLKAHGCEILPQSNEYESIRWKGWETSVVYNSMKTSGKYAAKAFD